MKKSMLLFVFISMLTLSVLSPQEVKSQDSCSGCWWNGVDQTCCENGSCCCGGGCGGGGSVLI